MYKRISGRPTAYLERNLEETAFGGYMKEGLQVAEITDIRLHESAADIVFANSNSETLLQRFFSIISIKQIRVIYSSSW
jgi:hypothetical protein